VPVLEVPADFGLPRPKSTDKITILRGV